MVLSLSNVSKSFADKVIFNNINLTIEDKDRIGLIGVNGAGKTTLLNMIIDKNTIDTGDCFIDKKTSIGYLKQNSILDKDSCIYDEMLSVFEELLLIKDKLSSLEEKIATISDHNSLEYISVSEEYSKLSTYFEINDGYNINVKIKTILNGMGFSDKSYSTNISTLSGGEKTRLALAKLLLEAPNLLILDEPTNHLDFKTLLWLEDYLLSYTGSILVVSHDRYFLDKMVTKIWEVSQQKVFTYTGNYSKYKVLKQERIIRELKEYEQQQNKIASMLDYAQKNIARASTSNSAKSRLHQLENMDILEKPQEYQKTPKFSFTYDITPVKDILIIENLTLRVGEENKVLCKDISFTVKRGDKIALIGRNGIGKSTLLKTILRENTQSIGDFFWGRNVSTSYYEQENSNLNFENTVLEELWSRYPNLPEFKVRSILGQMLITDDNVYKPISVISGGERARLGFAIMVTDKSNTLIFDEPTNHLDLDSKEELERALCEFDGTLIFVSHDRYFLNTIPNKIIEMTDEGLNVFDGNFDYFMEKNKATPSKPNLEENQSKPKTTDNKPTYRSKAQRSLEAQRRNQISQLEKLIKSSEEEIEFLQNEIASPDNASNYELLNEYCHKLEDVKTLNDAYMTEWLELQE